MKAGPQGAEVVRQRDADEMHHLKTERMLS